MVKIRPLGLPGVKQSVYNMYREQGLHIACWRHAHARSVGSLKKNASDRAAPVISPSSLRAQEALAASGNGIGLASQHAHVERPLLEGG